MSSIYLSREAIDELLSQYGSKLYGGYDREQLINALMGREFKVSPGATEAFTEDLINLGTRAVSSGMLTQAALEAFLIYRGEQIMSGIEAIYNGPQDNPHFAALSALEKLDFDKVQEAKRLDNEDRIKKAIEERIMINNIASSYAQNRSGITDTKRVESELRQRRTSNRDSKTETKSSSESTPLIAPRVGNAASLRNSTSNRNTSLTTGQRNISNLGIGTGIASTTGLVGLGVLGGLQGVGGTTVSPPSTNPVSPPSTNPVSPPSTNPVSPPITNPVSPPVTNPVSPPVVPSIIPSKVDSLQPWEKKVQLFRPQLREIDPKVIIPSKSEAIHDRRIWNSLERNHLDPNYRVGESSKSIDLVTKGDLTSGDDKINPLIELDILEKMFRYENTDILPRDYSHIDYISRNPLTGSYLLSEAKLASYYEIPQKSSKIMTLPSFYTGSKTDYRPESSYFGVMAVGDFMINPMPPKMRPSEKGWINWVGVNELENSRIFYS